MKGLKKVDVTLRERKSANLLANFFLWTATLIWILLFLASAFAFYDKAFSPAMLLYFKPESGPTTVSSFFQHCCEAWYVVTTVIIGIYTARKAFKLIGKWEPKGRGSSSEGPDAKGK